MGDSKDLVDHLKVICSYNLVSLMFIFSILFIYGIGKDYLLFNIYQVSVTLESMGSSPAWVTPFIVTVSNTADILPQYLDIFWLVLTITLFGELILASYYSDREGWFSTLGFMTFGILLLLFMTGLFSTIGTWFSLNFITGIFGAVSYTTPFLNLYLNNLFVVNTLLCVICIIANYIDLDFSGFQNRKQREDIKEVI